MEYVIYSAETREGSIVNITHNPSLDFEYLKGTLNINCIKVLTPYLSASDAQYILRNMVKDHGSRMKVMPKSREFSEKIRYEALKNLMHSLSLKPLNKPEIITSGCSLPPDEDMLSLCRFYEGRIKHFFELKDNKPLFLEGFIEDIVQILYLKGIVQIFPPFIIEKPGKRYVCSKCGREITVGGYESENIICCGNQPDDEPYIALPLDSGEKARTHLKYKPYRSLNSYQARASMELSQFIDEEIFECLLWTVPSSEDPGIFLDAIKRTLERGGRAGAAVSCPEEKELFLNCFRDAFPGLSSLEDNGGCGSIGDIVVCDFEGFYGYYKAFDLVIISENSPSAGTHDNNWYKHIKRAAKDGAKTIYASSSPGVKIYSRAEKKELKLVTVPLRRQGKPSPEPRILLCRGLSQDDLFIPGEVTDFVNWSMERGSGIGIVIPYSEQYDLLQNALIDSGIDGKYFNENSPSITMSSAETGHINVGEAENIVVFLADDEIFSERMLMDAAGLPGKLPSNEIGQVMFVGSRESDEMYNAKMMIRELNRNAWEMGYLK